MSLVSTNMCHAMQQGWAAAPLDFSPAPAGSPHLWEPSSPTLPCIPLDIALHH